MAITLQPSDAIFGYIKKEGGEEHGWGRREGGGEGKGRADKGRGEGIWNRVANWLRPVLRRLHKKFLKKVATRALIFIKPLLYYRQAYIYS